MKFFQVVNYLGYNYAVDAFTYIIVVALCMKNYATCHIYYMAGLKYLPL